MCGIFAFTGPASPDPALLATAAIGAAQRGPHGHGWAGHDLTPHRQLGPLNPCDLAGVSSPRLIGHARLATVGAYDNPAGIQPIAVQGHLLVHNGTITNWRDLSPAAITDTAALTDAYALRRQAGHAPADALTHMLARARQHAWAVVVLDATGVLVAHRHGLPLWCLTHPTGTYLCSRRLPGATLLPDGEPYLREPACLASPTALPA